MIQDNQTKTSFILFIYYLFFWRLQWVWTLNAKTNLRGCQLDHCIYFFYRSSQQVLNYSFFLGIIFPLVLSAFSSFFHILQIIITQNKKSFKASLSETQLEKKVCLGVTFLHVLPSCLSTGLGKEDGLKGMKMDCKGASSADRR